MKITNFFVGNANKREIARLSRTVTRINALEPDFEKLSDAELKQKTLEFKERIAFELGKKKADLEEQFRTAADAVVRTKLQQRAEQAILADLLPEAFAAVREAAKRVLGMRHYDEQLLGGLVLHDGKIAEMKTGEGKTLVATLPAYVNALSGHGVHVVTVNDYLAKRDAHWMGKVYSALGLTVAAIGHDQSWQYVDDISQNEQVADTDWLNLRAVSRRDAYHADITYGTNNEFGFDYLRDNMAQSPTQLVQRELWYAVVDEVDSILIDEARTPLIISAPAAESTTLYQTFAQVARRLDSATDYTVDEKFRSVVISDSGIKKVEDWIGLPNLYAPEHVTLVHHLEEALKAEALFTRDKDYVVREGEVVIVDEFTGRMMPGRRYSEGLHQAIEAKEGVEVKRESNTLATISFQNLFRLYAKLSGMTGTAATEAEEFWKIYQIEVVEVPTHRPLARIDHQDLIYKTAAGKLQAVIAEIKRRHELGQPVLVGTISVEKNEHLSKLLKQAGIPHEILNAKLHEREAKTIANAGKVGAVTVATNMAGRGVDILLGGEPPKATDPDYAQNFAAWEAEHQKVLELGGLTVIGTERHEARRIDNQLRGRAGRQGDPGETQFYVSMEDDLMRIFGGDRMKGLMDRLGLPEDQPIQAGMISKSLETAQRRVEGHNFDIRKHLVEYDDVMNRHREYIYRLRRRILSGETLHDETLGLFSDDERAAYEARSAGWESELVPQIERTVWLRTIDMLWVEHLNSMEALRTGIGLRGYGQHDPLVAYRQEAYGLFERLKQAIEQEVVRLLLSLEIRGQAPVATKEEVVPKNLTFKGADDSKSAGFRGDTSEQMNQEAERSTELADSGPKIGRNDLCHCGSGKKYKKCHGK